MILLLRMDEVEMAAMMDSGGGGGLDGVFLLLQGIMMMWHC